jgi:hypothetical protein
MFMMSSVHDLSMGMPTSGLVLYFVDAWLFAGFLLGALLVSDTHAIYKLFRLSQILASYFGGHFVTHDFGHLGDILTMVYSGSPQGIFT